MPILDRTWFQFLIDLAVLLFIKSHITELPTGSGTIYVQISNSWPILEPGLQNTGKSCPDSERCKYVIPIMAMCSFQILSHLALYMIPRSRSRQNFLGYIPILITSYCFSFRIWIEVRQQHSRSNQNLLDTFRIQSHLERFIPISITSFVFDVPNPIISSFLSSRFNYILFRYWSELQAAIRDIWAFISCMKSESGFKQDFIHNWSVLVPFLTSISSSSAHIWNLFLPKSAVTWSIIQHNLFHSRIELVPITIRSLF